MIPATAHRLRETLSAATSSARFSSLTNFSLPHPLTVGLASTFFQRRILYLSSLACWLALLGPALNAAPVDIFPERPPGMVIDKAGVLLPEKAAALNDDLLAGARDSGIWLYVLTLPSLNVRDSIRHERLSNIAHYYVDLWAKERLAMVIIIDDETSDSVFAASPAMDREFPPWARNIRLTQPLAKITSGKGLTREKLDQAARLTLTTLTEMREEAQAKARQRKVVTITMVAFLALGVAAIAYGTLRKKRSNSPTEDSAVESSESNTSGEKNSF
jgi:hypothetical protein